MTKRTVLACISVVSMVFALLAPSAVDAATIWTGPMTTYAQPASDPSLEVNWDRLTDRVAITRGIQNGLFNPLVEPEYVRFIGPAGTAWAYRFNNRSLDPAEITASNHARLAFSGWVQPPDWTPLDLIGERGVLHLLEEDIYLDFVFTDWRAGPGSASGFTWQRATVPEPGPTLLIGLGLAALAIRGKSLESQAGAASVPIREVRDGLDAEEGDEPKLRRAPR
ncbi:MAG: hypothetical protein R3F21_21495 [Myxococcota bacterium]